MQTQIPLYLGDQHIIDSLLNKESVEALEEILNEKQKDLFRLKTKKLFSARKSIIPLEEMEELVKVVENQVKDYLELEIATSPNYNIITEREEFYKGEGCFIAVTTGVLALCSVYGFTEGNLVESSLTFASLPLYYKALKFLSKTYNEESYNAGNIKLICDLPEVVIPATAHEITHYFQYQELCNIMGSFSREGHARGVQRIFSNKYAEDNDSELYKYEITNLDVGEVRSSYIWASKKRGMKTRKSLMLVSSVRDLYEFINRTFSKSPTEHSLGNSYFLIKEKEQGEPIFRDLFFPERHMKYSF